MSNTPLPNVLTPEQTTYFIQSLKRFPDADCAIKQLQKLNNPVPDTSVASFPSPEVEEACEVFASFMGLNFPPHSLSIETRRHLRAHWESVISPWALFLLRQLLVHEHSSTPGWVVTIDRLTIALPIVFQLTTEDLKRIKHLSPSLQPLIVQVFLLKLDKNHLWWGAWAKVLNDLVISDLFNSSPSPEPSPVSGTPVIYPTDVHLGEMLTRNFNFRITDLRNQKPHFGQLRDFQVLLNLLVLAQHCFGGIDPLKLGENPPRFLVSRAEALKIFVRRRTSHPIDSTEWNLTFDIVANILSSIELDLCTPNMVHHVLDCGLLRVLYRVDERFYDTKRLDRRGHTMSEGIEEVIKQISIFLVYASVLRTFTRVERKLPIPSRIVGEWGKVWSDITYTASRLSFQHRKAESLFGKCSYGNCPLRKGRPRDDLPIEYVRCLGCSVNVYCSWRCRRTDWCERHRNECPKISQMAKNGLCLPFTRMDRGLCFMAIIRHLNLKANTHNNAIEDYRKSMLTRDVATPQDQAIRDGSQNPVVYLDFRQQFISSAVPARVMDTDNFANLLKSKQGWTDEYVSHLLGYLSSLDHTKVMVFALFPRNRGAYLPLHTSVDYPLRRMRM
ncbi:hypothetical protein PM082_019620 [Marasmius tenuissimus]|nr:hypothetical protein PM082_019620 [Marasmius tenuissimus]